MKIGNLDIRYPTMLAPMASLTDVAFRKLLDEIGHVGLMVTEMISVEGIRRRNRKTLAMLRSFHYRTPHLIQLFGYDTDSYQYAVQYVENETNFGGIDVNMGCPANKVIKRGAGSALLKDPKQVEKILRTIKNNTALPLTVKIRLGFNSVNVIEIMKVLNGEGVDAVTVHFRLKTDRYSDPCHWEYAPLVQKASHCLVWGNGDITSADLARERMAHVDGVAIGRGAVINPFIFSEIAGKSPTESDYQDMVKRLTELIREFYDPALRLVRLKSLARFMVSRKAHARQIRQKIYSASCFENACTYLREMTAEKSNLSKI